MFLTKKSRLSAAFFVRWAGVEPARPHGHMALNHACLPFPAPAHERMGKNHCVDSYILLTQIPCNLD